MKVKDMTTKQLKADYKDYYGNVYISECFSSSDINNLGLIEKELARRGIEIEETKKVKFVKVLDND